MHRNGKRIALSLVAIVLGAGFLLKVIPPETVIGENDHHTASIDGLLITNPVDVSDPVAPTLFPPAPLPNITEVSDHKSDSPLWIPGEPTSEGSLASPGVTPAIVHGTNNEPPPTKVHEPGPEDKSQPGPETNLSNPINPPGPLVHAPKGPSTSNGGPSGGSNGGSGSQPGSPGDDSNPPPQDGPPPPESGPANPPPDHPAGNDGDDPTFPPTGPGDFPNEDSPFPSGPDLPTGGKDLPDAPHSVPDQGSSFALTFAGLIAVLAAKRAFRR